METLKHKMKAQLYSNALAEDKNSLIARVSSEKSLSTGEVAELAVKRKGVVLPTAIVRDAVGIWLQEMAYLMCDGFSIHTELFTVTPRIKGSFESINDKFDPAKHSIVFDIRNGKLLKEELKSTEVAITGMANTSVAIAQAKDIKTGSVNDIITPGHNLRISGSKLKIVGKSSANGVWFVNSRTNSRTKAEASDMASNKPSELIIVVPELEKGIYILSVVTQYTTGALLKKPRTAKLDKLLTVT